ncbi:hypothetical protein, partial [Streptomyces sp. NPDC056160]|uniref:hypothetical protein n=1 Tax=Streptomyces sp. NPDC056160 TaxID=3345731 RepID=UPI0035E31A1A
KEGETGGWGPEHLPLPPEHPVFAPIPDRIPAGEAQRLKELQRYSFIFRTADITTQEQRVHNGMRLPSRDFIDWAEAVLGGEPVHQDTERILIGLGMRLGDRPGSTFKPYRSLHQTGKTATTQKKIDTLDAYYRMYPESLGERPPRSKDKKANEVLNKAVSLTQSLMKVGFDPLDAHLVAAFDRFGVKLQGKVINGAVKLFPPQERKVTLNHKKGSVPQNTDTSHGNTRQELAGGGADEGTRAPGRRANKDQEVRRDTITANIRYQYRTDGIPYPFRNFRSTNNVLKTLRQGSLWEYRGGDTTRMYLAPTENEHVADMEAAKIAPGTIPPLVTRSRGDDIFRSRVGDFFWNLQRTGIPESHRTLVGWLTVNGY